MDKCTYCAGGPEVPLSERERRMYGANRIAEGKTRCPPKPRSSSADRSKSLSVTPE
jgi:hypothetical protein